GFFETCEAIGLSGTQGVVLPEANVDDLMLREDVVQACAEGRFHVYAVSTIQQALEIFSGRPAGVRGANNLYPEGTFLAEAVRRAREFWKMATKHTTTVMPAPGMDQARAAAAPESTDAHHPSRTPRSPR